MSNTDIKQAAKNLIDAQIAVQKKFGTTPKITRTRYRAAVNKAEKTFKQVFNIKK